MLHAVRWRRRRGQLVAVAAAVAVAVVLPITVLRPAGGQPPAATPAPTEAGLSPAPPAPTRLPALDGGPRALHAFTAAASGRTSVLDVRTGRYRELPYETVQLSPDLARIAVMDRRGRTGIAGRAALLRDGDRAVSWTALPAGSGLLWSPDGSALLLATLDKSAGAVSHTVLRYDLRSRLVTSTPVPAGIALIGTPTWAANSRDYLLLPVAEESGAGSGPARCAPCTRTALSLRASTGRAGWWTGRRRTRPPAG